MEPRKLLRVEETTVVEVMGTGYPDKDWDGKYIFENSHFVYAADAWEAMLAERAAHVSLSGRSVADAKRELAKAEKEAGNAAELFALAKDNFDRWKRGAK
jgi:hypothetical protein